MAMSKNGYAVWLMPEGSSLKPVIQALSSSELEVFEPHLTLFAPEGKAAHDLSFFTGALERAVSTLRQQLGAKKGQSMALHLQLDYPAAGLDWYNAIFAPVVETSGSAAALRLRALLERECGEKPIPTGYFPFFPDDGWAPVLPLAYQPPHSVGMEAMAHRADMVVKAGNAARFPMAVRCPELLIVDVRGEIGEWKTVAAVQL